MTFAARWRHLSSSQNTWLWLSNQKIERHKQSDSCYLSGDRVMWCVGLTLSSIKLTDRSRVITSTYQLRMQTRHSLNWWRYQSSLLFFQQATAIQATIYTLSRKKPLKQLLFISKAVKNTPDSAQHGFVQKHDIRKLSKINKTDY